MVTRRMGCLGLRRTTLVSKLDRWEQAPSVGVGRYTGRAACIHTRRKIRNQARQGQANSLRAMTTGGGCDVLLAATWRDGRIDCTRGLTVSTVSTVWPLCSLPTVLYPSLPASSSRSQDQL